MEGVKDDDNAPASVADNIVLNNEEKKPEKINNNNEKSSDDEEGDESDSSCSEEDGESSSEEDEEDSESDDDIQITIGDFTKGAAVSSNKLKGRGQFALNAGAKSNTPKSAFEIDVIGTYKDQQIYDVLLESIEDKPWRKPGADITDFFNYGFNEEIWTIYCKKQKQMRSFPSNGAFDINATPNSFNPVLPSSVPGNSKYPPILINRGLMQPPPPPPPLHAIPIPKPGLPEPLESLPPMNRIPGPPPGMFPPIHQFCPPFGDRDFDGPNLRPQMAPNNRFLPPPMMDDFPLRFGGSGILPHPRFDEDRNRHHRDYEPDYDRDRSSDFKRPYRDPYDEPSSASSHNKRCKLEESPMRLAPVLNSLQPLALSRSSPLTREPSRQPEKERETPSKDDKKESKSDRDRKDEKSSKSKSSSSKHESERKSKGKSSSKDRSSSSKSKSHKSSSSKGKSSSKDHSSSSKSKSHKSSSSRSRRD